MKVGEIEAQIDQVVDLALNSVFIIYILWRN